MTEPTWEILPSFSDNPAVKSSLNQETVIGNTTSVKTLTAIFMAGVYASHYCALCGIRQSQQLYALFSLQQAWFLLYYGDVPRRFLNFDKEKESKSNSLRNWQHFWCECLEWNTFISLDSHHRSVLSSPSSVKILLDVQATTMPKIRVNSFELYTLYPFYLLDVSERNLIMVL